MRKLRTLPAALDSVARLCTRSGGPPRPTRKRCVISGWLSPEDHGDPESHYASVHFNFLESIVERLSCLQKKPLRVSVARLGKPRTCAALT
jgi:hypothetical protein